jgi:hypothetical protein
MQVKMQIQLYTAAFLLFLKGIKKAFSKAASNYPSPNSF